MGNKSRLIEHNTDLSEILTAIENLDPAEDARKGKFTWGQYTIVNGAKGEFVDYVVNDVNGAYPKNGIKGGYWYTLVGSNTPNTYLVSEYNREFKYLYTTDIGTIPGYPLRASNGMSSSCFDGTYVYYFVTSSASNVVRSAYSTWDDSHTSSQNTSITTANSDSRASIVYYNDVIYLLGQYIQTCPKGGTSFTKSSMSVPWDEYNNAKAIVFNGLVYIFAKASSSDTSLSVYTFNGTSFTKLSATIPINSTVNYVAIAASGDNVHICGGSGTSSHYILSKTHTVTVSTDIPYQISGSPCMVDFGGKPVLIGGRGGTGNYITSYYFENNSWKSMGSSSSSLYYANAITINNHIYYAGTDGSSILQTTIMGAYAPIDSLIGDFVASNINSYQLDTVSNGRYTTISTIKSLAKFMGMSYYETFLEFDSDTVPGIIIPHDLGKVPKMVFVFVGDYINKTYDTTHNYVLNSLNNIRGSSGVMTSMNTSGASGVDILWTNNTNGSGAYITNAYATYVIFKNYGTTKSYFKSGLKYKFIMLA